MNERTRTSCSPSPRLDDRRTIINAEDLEEARRDPRIRRFWDEAIAYGTRLRREGRDHSV